MTSTHEKATPFNFTCSYEPASPSGDNDALVIADGSEMVATLHGRGAKFVLGLLNRSAEFEEVVGAIENYLIKLQDFANDGSITFKVAFDDAEARLNSLLTRIRSGK